jgi:hypothetical protein
LRADDGAPKSRADEFEPDDAKVEINAFQDVIGRVAADREQA